MKLLLKKIKTLYYNIVFFLDYEIWLDIKKKFPKTINDNEKWITSKKNLYLLKKIIKKYKPKKILEYGSGIGVSSEAMISQMSNDCSFVGIENNDHCVNECLKRTKKYEKDVEFIKTEIVISKEMIGIETLIYKYTKNIKADDLDLIYIDGPSFLLKNNIFYEGMVRGDFFHIYENLKPGCIIVVDGGQITRKHIIRFCKSIEFLKILNVFAIKLTNKDKLKDHTFEKLKKMKYI